MHLYVCLSHIGEATLRVMRKRSSFSVILFVGKVLVFVQNMRRWHGMASWMHHDRRMLSRVGDGDILRLTQKRWHGQVRWWWRLLFCRKNSKCAVALCCWFCDTRLLWQNWRWRGRAKSAHPPNYQSFTDLMMMVMARRRSSPDQIYTCLNTIASLHCRSERTTYCSSTSTKQIQKVRNR